MKKIISMKETRFNGKNWETECEKEFVRLSRWIRIKQNYNPKKNNSLWDYVTDENGYKPYNEKFNPEEGLFLDYFTFNGKNYALEQFYRLGNPFFVPVSYSYETEDGKVNYLSGIDMDGNIYNPLYIEIDENGEFVRVYEMN